MKPIVKIVGKTATGGVSRYLNPEHRSWAMLLYQQENKALDSEVNLQGQLALHQLSEMARAHRRESGFCNLVQDLAFDSGTGVLTFASGNDLAPYAVVRGQLLEVVNPTDDAPELSVTIPDLTPPPSSYVVLLEMWFEEVQPDIATEAVEEEVVRYGNDEDTTLYTNDLEDPALGAETSRRVQARYMLRMVDSVDFDTYEEGVNDPTVRSVRSATYGFAGQDDEPGLYMAGDGSEAAATAMGTVDGYTYALPMAKLVYDTPLAAWLVTDLRHALEPLHKEDAWPIFETMLQAISGDEGLTYGGVYRYLNELEVHNLREDGGVFKVDVDTGAALITGRPFRNLAEVVGLELGPQPSGAYCRGYTVFAELNKRTRRTRLVVRSNPDELAEVPSPPATLNDDWVTEISLGRISLFGPSHAQYAGEYWLADSRTLLNLSANFDEVYIRQDGGGAENADATKTLWGINNGLGVGVQGESHYGAGGFFLSDYGPSVLTKQAAILHRASWPALAQRKWYEIDQVGRTWATGVLANAGCASPTHLFFIGASGSTLYKFAPGDFSSPASAACGTTPVHCCFDGMYIWVLNQGSNNLTKILASTMAVSATYSLGVTFVAAQAVEYDGVNIWVMGSTASYSTVLLKVNPTSGVVVNTYNFSTWTGIRLLPVRDKLVVSVFPGTGSIKRLDKAGVVEATYSLPSYYEIKEWAYDGTYLDVLMSVAMGSCSLYTISPWNGQTRGQLQLSGYEYTSGIVFDGYRFWVSYQSSGGAFSVQAIHAADLTKITESEVSGVPSMGLALDPYGGIWGRNPSFGVYKMW